MSAAMRFIYTFTNTAISDVVAAAAIIASANPALAPDGNPTGVAVRGSPFIGTIQNAAAATPSAGTITLTVCVAFNANFLAAFPTDADQQGATLNYYTKALQLCDRVGQVVETSRTNIAVCP